MVCYMETATVRDLRNHYSRVIDIVTGGQEVTITRYGKPVAKLIPVASESRGKVDWSQCEAVTLDRSQLPCPSAEESLSFLKEAGGKW
ncbi:MAG: type II toxin-antitoxin system Phd/YefM family antitoxin [Verrucomicrobiota bacterium]